MNTKTRAAIYMRVSTEEQTVENQLPELQRLAESRGIEIVSTYKENISATKHRPQFEKMMADAHKGKFKAILVVALDRLHRSMLGALQAVLDLDRRGVQVISVREPWLDTAGPVRSLLIAIFGWVSEQERLRVSERTKAGLDRARRRGIQLGRRPVDVDLERLLRLRADGGSIRAVAKVLGISVGKAHALIRGSVQESPSLVPSEVP